MLHIMVLFYLTFFFPASDLAGLCDQKTEEFLRMALEAPDDYTVKIRPSEFPLSALSDIHLGSRPSISSEKLQILFLVNP